MPNEKIIYIVTNGEYSDYKICGVFDDPQLAKEFQEAGGYGNIEEHTLNPYVFQLRKGWNIWKVEMLKNGDVVTCKMDNTYLDWKLPNFFFYKSGLSIPTPEGFFRGIMLARSEAHAIKIVNEKRTQFIAEDRWGLNRTRHSA